VWLSSGRNNGQIDDLHIKTISPCCISFCFYLLVLSFHGIAIAQHHDYFAFTGGKDSERAVAILDLVGEERTCSSGLIN
jgi:hypothetical protein